MATGQVKWFNNAKGYGFIRPDQDGPDLFVHYSYINMGGYKTLKAGQAVSFDIKTVNSGAHAVNLNLQEAIGLQHAAATPTTQTVPQSS